MSRGLRNNNPGNIRHGSDRWQGEIIPSQDKDFKQFQSMAYGYRAMTKLLQNYSRLHGCKTIRQMISRWAPPCENNTEGYIKVVSDWTGIGPDELVDINSSQQMCCLAAAISRMENGRPAVMEDIYAGWNLL